MKVVKGDLLNQALAGKFDVIVHGCNCFCNMGAGIAISIRKQFPEAYNVDKQTRKGDRFKLGGFTYCDVKRGNIKFTIVNAYTQFRYGSDKVHVDYDALREVFKGIKTRYSGKRIGYPKIGAGLAGGDWNLISKIISEELDGEDHTLVEYISE